MLSPNHLAPNGDASTSQFLSHKFPSTRQSLSARRSSASLRASQPSQNAGEETANGRHHSLAHELAVALMPEPSAGSKLLAEEFGIEYDEGAEGIDEEPQPVYPTEDPSFSDKLAAQPLEFESERDPESVDSPIPHEDTVDDSPLTKPKRNNQPELDAMDVLARNIESTDKFLVHLRHLDSDSNSAAAQPTLEKIALDVIRRINDTSRDREEQLRALSEYEREFKRIAGEVGGSDVLGQLDELTGVEELSDEKPPPPVPKVNGPLETVEEEAIDSSHDWESELDEHQLGDEIEEPEPDPLTPTKIIFAPPPPIHGPPTPSTTIPRLADLRSFTSSLVGSLTTISEQAQVNGAATTEAGRKLRALKNKLGEWRMDWDSAEVSRTKIERWEAGIADDAPDGVPQPSKRTSLSRRVDGRKLVKEHLRAFELALADAAIKTKEIMATS